MLVLAVEGEQARAERPQLGGGGRAPADEGARAARGADPPAEHDLVGVVGQPLGDRRPARGRRAARAGSAKTPSTQASSAPGRTICGRARPPISRSSECASTVLPAPVSPVIAFRPAPRRSSARSISSRFSIRSSCSTPPVLAAGADGFAPAALRTPARARARPAPAPAATAARPGRGGAPAASWRSRPTKAIAAPTRRISLSPETNAWFGGLRRLAREAAAAPRRPRSAVAPEATASANASGACGSSSPSLDVDPRLEDRAERRGPGRDPDLAEGAVDPRCHPGAGGVDDADRDRGDPGVGHADADSGDDRSPAAASVQLSPTSIPCISISPSPTRIMPGPHERPRRDPVEQLARRSARPEREHRQRQEAQARPRAASSRASPWM